MMMRQSIDQEAHPTAVCNDGSTPIFYLRRGERAKRWVVWFKGGEACHEAEDCARREPSLTSSDPWRRIPSLGADGNPSSADGGANGILSDDPQINPDFHDWNHAYLVYCSSDNWSGDREASAATHGFHFRGHAIVSAMFDALRDPKQVGGPSLGEATDIVLAGSSAGAAGLRNNLDRIAALFPKAKVRGLSDAGLTPSASGRRGSQEAEVWTRRQEVWGSVVDTSCAAAHPGADRWKCLEGRYLAAEHLLETPTFFSMDQRDPKVMGQRDPDHPEEARAASAEIRELLSAQDGAFGPALGRHVFLNQPAFGRDKCEGQTLAQVFGNWYFDRAGPKVAIDPGDQPLRRRRP